MARTDFHKVIIGRSEILHIVDFAVADIPAKVDTGAYHSAVHADNIQLTDDSKTLSFKLLGNHPLCGNLATTIATQDFEKIWIANSFGHREERYKVKLRVKIGPKKFWATFTLADRSKKIYPVLLGRQMLDGRFIVDTAQSRVNRANLKQQYGIEFPIDQKEGKQE